MDRRNQGPESHENLHRTLNAQELGMGEQNCKLGEEIEVIPADELGVFPIEERLRMVLDSKEFKDVLQDVPDYR